MAWLIVPLCWFGENDDLVIIGDAQENMNTHLGDEVNGRVAIYNDYGVTLASSIEGLLTKALNLTLHNCQSI